MATTTKIEWADKTWSPIIGCDRVSPGCDHCYAMNTARIREFNPNKKIATAFAGTTLNDGNGVDWTGKVNLLNDRLYQPLRWKNPAKVFVNSMSDLFHTEVPDAFIAKTFAVMALTPHHTYQILSKRHARMRSLLGTPAFRLACEEAEAEIMGDETAPIPQYQRNAYRRQWWSHFAEPLRNVWLGVSVEDQKWADIRIPALLDTPAAVRFLSCEPLLGPIDLGEHLLVPCPCCKGEPHEDGCGPCDDAGCDTGFVRGIHWVIAGGESGHGARVMHPDWVREIRDECQQTHTPFLMKQWGEWAPSGAVVIRSRPEPGSVLVGDSVDELGHRVEMRRIGKKRAGREIDGREWNQYPEVRRG